MLPNFITNAVRGRQGLLDVLSNTSWLLIDRVLRLGVGLLINIWVARYLGLDQFGLFNYFIAVFSIFGIVANFGLESIVVRNLVKDSESTDQTLGTAFAVMVIGSLVASTLFFIFMNIVEIPDESGVLISLILCLTLLTRPSDIIKFWFESQVQSKNTVIAENLAFLISAGIRAGLILLRFPLIAFVWVVLIEALLSAIGLFIIYHLSGRAVRTWRFNKLTVPTLVKDSFPMLISNASIVLYMRLDQVMIGQMIDEGAVGIYSVASKLSEVWYFIPVAITSSVGPMLLRLRYSNPALFDYRMSQLFGFMIWTSISVAIIFQFAAQRVISDLYGAQYLPAVEVLKIHIWAGVFVFINNASWNWYIAENKQHIANVRIVVGLFVNIILNIILIPEMGVLGAAWATLISRCMVGYFGHLLSAQTRPLFFLINRSVFFWKTFKPISL